MIRIGLGIRQKEKLINEYIKENNIKKVIVLYSKLYKQKLKIDCEYDEYEYADWEMYKYFYPLIAEIDASYLVVINEALCTTNYQDLKFNCATIYTNQTPHRMIFNHYPFIEDKEDFRILQKLDQGSKQVAPFEYTQLQTQDIRVKPQKIKIEIADTHITTDKQKKSYENQKEKLIKEAEENVNMDPNVIPRRLQLKAGDYKKSMIEEDKVYIARNSRFKLDNVHTYQNYDKNVDYIFLDLPTSKKDLIYFLLNTKINKIKYLSTDLNIDKVIINDLNEWKARLDGFYVKANLYK